MEPIVAVNITARRIDNGAMIDRIITIFDPLGGTHDYLTWSDLILLDQSVLEGSDKVHFSFGIPPIKLRRIVAKPIKGTFQPQAKNMEEAVAIASEYLRFESYIQARLMILYAKWERENLLRGIVHVS